MPSQPMLEPSRREVLCRHWLGMGLLGVLAVTVLPAWGLNGSVFAVDADGLHVLNTFVRVLGQFYLLPAMAFWLALRRGAVDLSVWAVSGLGGLLAAMLINAGMSVPASFALAVGAGLAIGAVNGLVAAWTRFASPVFTLIVAAIIVAGAAHLAPQRSVRVPDETFGSPLAPDVADAWADAEKGDARDAGPLLPEQLRMVLVLIAYAAVMAAMLSWRLASPGARRRAPDRLGLFAAMAAAGALSAAAGAFWLVDQGAAPVPTRLIGDLRVPAAALLAGGILWIGRGRTILSGLFLPISVLLVTAWRQEVTALADVQRSSGYALQLLLLICMLLSAHLALMVVIRARGPLRTVAGVCLGVILLTLTVIAYQSLLGPYPGKELAELLCIRIWLTATAICVPVPLFLRTPQTEKTVADY